VAEDPPRVTAIPVAIPPAAPATIGIQTFRCVINGRGLTFVSSIEARIIPDSGGNPSIGAFIPITTNCPTNKVACAWSERACSDFLTTFAPPTAVTETVPT
jgi:hypothetical protein